MRNKFTELINKGIAPFNYTQINPEMPELDLFCRTYNNIWSIPSDTHMGMDKTTGDYYITGHMISNTDVWSKFICSPNWGAVNFRTTGYWSLCDFLQANGYKGEFSSLNGDLVYKVSKIGDDLHHNVCCPNACCTSESQIPQPLAQLVKNGDVMKIRECYHEKQNLYEICEALNNNIYIKGDMWTVTSNNHIMCPIENKIYIL